MHPNVVSDMAQQVMRWHIPLELQRTLASCCCLSLNPHLAGASGERPGLEPTAAGQQPADSASATASDAGQA